VRVAVDATALGSGRGGDETALRGLLAGLAEVVADDGITRFRLYLRSGQPPPATVWGSPVFPIRTMPRVPAVGRYLVAFPLVAGRESPPPSLLYSVTHSPLVASAPMVLHLHDLSFVQQPTLYTLRTRLRLALSMPIHVRGARAIFTASEFSRQSIIEHYRIPSAKVFVVPNAIEPRAPVRKRADADQRAWLESFGIRGPFFVYVGNLHPRKNLHRLIEAFVRSRRTAREVAGHQLLIVGTEHAFYPRLSSEGIASAIAQLPERAVVFTGKVTDEERDQLVSAATALTYPSLYEGFGLPPLEAMALGTPVLASTTTSMPEVLGDAALLVDPRDVDAIARGLVRLVGDAGLRSELQTRGAARAALFSPRRTGLRALEAFRCVLATASHREKRLLVSTPE
jgi:glycosyltransferase involved in cell wall biosynthesis